MAEVSAYRTNRTSELIAYAHYLSLKGQHIGLTTIDGHELTDEEEKLKNEICRTCDSIAKLLSNCKAGDIADLTGYYSILFMIGYCKMPDTSIINEQKERLFKLWETGNKTIEESHFYGIMSEASQITPLPASQQQAFINLRTKWIQTLEMHGTFPGTDTNELYKRLALIMRDNIDSYFNGDSTTAKSRWYEKNRIANLTVVGSKILTAYHLFIKSLFPALKNSEEMRALEIPVLKELIVRNDLNDFDRKAYQLALC